MLPPKQRPIHILVKVPRPRPKNFVEPTATLWTKSRQRTLWHYLSQNSRDSIDWVHISRQLGIPVLELMRYSTFLYEQQIQQLKRQLYQHECSQGDSLTTVHHLAQQHSDTRRESLPVSDHSASSFNLDVGPVEPVLDTHAVYENHLSRLDEPVDTTTVSPSGRPEEPIEDRSDRPNSPFPVFPGLGRMGGAAQSSPGYSDDGCSSVSGVSDRFARVDLTSVDSLPRVSQTLSRNAFQTSSLLSARSHRDSITKSLLSPQRPHVEEQIVSTSLPITVSTSLTTPQFFSNSPPLASSGESPDAMVASNMLRSQIIHSMAHSPHVGSLESALLEAAQESLLPAAGEVTLVPMSTTESSLHSSMPGISGIVHKPVTGGLSEESVGQARSSHHGDVTPMKTSNDLASGHVRGSPQKVYTATGRTTTVTTDIRVPGAGSEVEPGVEENRQPLLSSVQSHLEIPIPRTISTSTNLVTRSGRLPDPAAEFFKTSVDVDCVIHPNTRVCVSGMVCNMNVPL
ncbi:hypothetical protein IWQ61_002819 [Dispira simplex]|nr:hypothetical protein IWQ61_002819 [Dispira simplex]